MGICHSVATGEDFWLPSTDGAGFYEVVAADVTVTAAPLCKTVFCYLPLGSVVDVVETTITGNPPTIWGRIATPDGWISLRLANGGRERWAERLTSFSILNTVPSDKVKSSTPNPIEAVAPAPAPAADACECRDDQRGQWQSTNLSSSIVGHGERPPQMLHVRSPNGQQSCAGIYHLFLDEAPNGQPCWRHEDETRWLYSSKAGRWCIGGRDVRSEQFSRSAGFVSSINCHGGYLPHKSLLEWQRWDGQAFLEDNTINISVRHLDETQVSLGAEQRNTQPQQEATGAIGMAAAIETPAVCQTPVCGAAVGLETSSSRSAVLVPRPPQSHQETPALDSFPAVLRIVTPNKHPSCEGFYDLVMDCRPHSYPLWRKRGGNRWIYRGSDSRWYIGGTMSKRQQFRCQSGYIYHDEPGCFRPDLLTGPWSWGDTEAWHADSAIEVRPSTQVELSETPRHVASLSEDLNSSRYSHCSSFSGHYGSVINSNTSGCAALTN